jgi:U32 family peptidase
MKSPDMTPELLSPAGNWDCARAAVAAGADAIYFGLSRFNARLRADNFTEEDLPELMQFLHKHGVKGFIAMNTLVFTAELEAAEHQLRCIAEAGVDALIIQDLGLAKMARTIAPQVELHASTQMTITSPEGLSFLESIFPMERAVLSRELSLSEIEHFRGGQTPLEVFVHGALCVAYSGQCLTSESLGQRSANRGECAQACRMPYTLIVDGEKRELGEVRYLLSPQDLAAVDLIPQLLEAGVKSFKIEGRLKSPEYVAAVTRVYRKAIDAAMEGNPLVTTWEDRYPLEMTFSRGLTTGWLAGTNHPYLTHGRYGKKRGPYLGEIAEFRNGWVELKDTSLIPIAPGDGVVFDAGEDRNHEQGASVWKVHENRLLFHRQFSGLDFSRITEGQKLFKTSDPKLESEIRRFWLNAKLTPRKKGITITVSGGIGQQMLVKAACGEAEVTVSSTMPLQESQQRPLNADVCAGQFERLGDTEYELKTVDFQITDSCYLPLSELNRIRREFCAQLDTRQEVPVYQASSVDYRELLPEKAGATPSRETALASVLCRQTWQIQAAIDEGITSIYCDFEDPRRYREALEIRNNSGSDAKIILATPRIIKAGESGYLKQIERFEPDGVLIRNLAALAYYRDRENLQKIGDFSLNVANPITASILKEKGQLDRLTISYDLNISQVMDLLGLCDPNILELTIHQHMPMFHMEHCVFCTFLSNGTTYKDCGRPCEKHVVHLKDRVGQSHRLFADVGCRNTLFNGRAQTGARFFGALHDAGLRHFRIELLDDDEATTRKTLRNYVELLDFKIDSETLIDRIEASDKLGVTEGTLQF